MNPPSRGAFYVIIKNKKGVSVLGDFSLEHRIFRDKQNLRKRSTGAEFESDFHEIYNEYLSIYKDYFYGLIINLIKYENVPETFDQSGLEWLLRTFGYANIQAVDSEHIYVSGVNSENIGLGSLGDLFSIGSPVANVKNTVQLTRVNAGTVNKDKAVSVTMANKFSYLVNGGNADDMRLIDRTAKTLAEIKASSIANMRQLKTPFIGMTTDGNLSSLNAWHQLASGKPFIQIDAQANQSISDVLQVANLGVQNMMPSLKDEWTNNLRELLTVLGLDNVDVDKKERLVAGEVSSNNQLIKGSLAVYLDARNERLALLNKQLGTNIRAVLNTEILEEVEENVIGEIYNNSRPDDDGLRTPTETEEEDED